MNIGDLFITSISKDCFYVSIAIAAIYLFTMFKFNGFDCQAQLTLRQFVSILVYHLK